MNELLLLPIHSLASEERWSSANRDVLWGWKRDLEARQRVILFAGTLTRVAGTQVAIQNWFFYYQVRDETSVIQDIHNRLAESEEIMQVFGGPSTTRADDGMMSLRLKGGPSICSAAPLITRLMQRRPRYHIPQGSLPPETQSTISLNALAPIALYAGSGLSYESGIPTLAEVHQIFGVDNTQTRELIFGRNDPIPHRMAQNVTTTLADFVALHLRAAEVEPSFSHLFFADLFSRGLVTQILTDNVDNLFATVGVPFQRTRGIGIFNETCPVSFDKARTLMVVGVAADRRSVIHQARSQGLRIVVVNPMLPVSPLSQNLSYLRKHDIWYRMTAHQFCSMHQV